MESSEKIKKFKKGMQFTYHTKYGGKLLLIVDSTYEKNTIHYVVAKVSNFDNVKRPKLDVNAFTINGYNSYEVENCTILDRKYKLERLLGDEDRT